MSKCSKYIRFLGKDEDMILTGDIGATDGKLTAFANMHDPESVLDTATFRLSQHSDEQPGDFLGQDLPNLFDAIGSLEGRYGQIEAVALAVAGKLNAAPSAHERTHLVDSGNLRHWIGQPLKELLTGRYKCRVVLGNDAEAAALADAVFGLGTRAEFRGRDLIGMIWGSGIGGACVRYSADGGYRTIPGEPGHIVLDPASNIKCGCGKTGHLESICSGLNVKKRYGKLFKHLDAAIQTSLAGLVAQGLWSILAVQPVDLVVFSGGVACDVPNQLEYIESLLKDPMVGSPQVRLSAFGETAGARGALSLLSL